MAARRDSQGRFVKGSGSASGGSGGGGRGGGVRTTDRDKGWKKIQDEMRRYSNRKGTGPFVKIGWQEGSGIHEPPPAPAGKAGVKGPRERLTNVQVATFLEFGTENGIPERSVVRATVDQNREKYRAILSKLHWMVMRREATVAQVLGLLGEKIRADMLNRINAGIPPPNAARTVEAKGSSKPWVDTGQLKQSLTYVVGED